MKTIANLWQSDYSRNRGYVPFKIQLRFTARKQLVSTGKQTDFEITQLKYRSL